MALYPPEIPQSEIPEWKARYRSTIRSGDVALNAFRVVDLQHKQVDRLCFKIADAQSIIRQCEFSLEFVNANLRTPPIIRRVSDFFERFSQLSRPPYEVQAEHLTAEIDASSQKIGQLEESVSRIEMLSAYNREQALRFSK